MGWMQHGKTRGQMSTNAINMGEQVRFVILNIGGDS